MSGAESHARPTNDVPDGSSAASDGFLSSWVLRATTGSFVLAAILAVFVVVVNGVGSAVTQPVLIIFLVNLPVVVGLQTFSGNSGVISFGHVAFMAIGAYTAALMSTPVLVKQTELANAPAFIRNAHFGFVGSALIAVAVTACVAFPLGFVFARLAHPAAASIASLGWLVIAQTIIANWYSVTHGTATFYGIPSYTTVWNALLCGVIVIVAAMTFRRSPIGYGLRATKSNPLVARAIGVNMVRARVAAWVLSAALAAVGGVLYSGYLVSLAPSNFFFSLTVTIVVMAIIGGPTVSGAVVGAIVISVLNEVLRRVETATSRPGLSTVVVAAIFTALMMTRPEGLLGRWELDEIALRGLRRLILSRTVRLAPRSREEVDAP